MMILPILSITTQPNITEGDEIEIVITSPLMVLEDLNVNLNITQIGNYIVEAVPNQITISRTIRFDHIIG